ncbi:MAG: 23S rRNA (pseudouridine(1915)-N(3))-methyltransferase RlmH [Oscillospiraceae bacterium]|nr:23S rRNA (pseudouridine(1915)-N(3))-methyltransferase RlmH [Oscillospiraceae bacterium]
MLSVRIICVGKLKEKFYIDAAGEYIKRLAGYCKLDVVELLEDKQQNLRKEGAAIEAKIPSGAYVVAMCVEGQHIDSEELSKLLRGRAVEGISKICFIIGGSEGMDEELKGRADMKLSMSKMTFPHHLARIMLLEQIYRAFKISEGGKYHK